MITARRYATLGSLLATLFLSSTLLGDINNSEINVAFADMPQEVQDFLNQSPYQGALSNAQYWQFINDTTIAPNASDIYEAELADGKLVGVAPDGTHLYTIVDANAEVLNVVPQPILDWIEQTFPGETPVEVVKDVSESGANSITYEVVMDENTWIILGEDYTPINAASGGTGSDNLTPVVSNVTAMQIEGTKQMEIFYDLAVADNHSCTVTIQWSTDNGATYPLTASAVTGAAGPGVVPGVGKQVLWDMEVDWDNQFTQTGRIKVIASREVVIHTGSNSDTGSTSEINP